ncbi:hypothetical protein ScPMuIL_000137 [Solemya velum]
MWFVLAFATCAFVGVTRGQEDCQNNLQLFCMLGKASGMMDCEKKSWHNNCMLSCGGCGDNTHAAYSMDHSTCSDHPLCEQSRKDGQLDCFKTSTKMYCPSSCGRCQHEAEQEHSHCTDHPMCGVKRPVDCSSPTHANYCPWSCGRCAHERHETDLAPAVCDVLVEHLGCGEFWVSEHCRTMCRVPTTGVLTTENRGHIEVTATNKQIIDGGDESSITAANQTTENGRRTLPMKIHFLRLTDPRLQQELPRVSQKSTM